MSRDSVTQLRAIDIAETLAYKKGIVDLWYYFYQDTDEELQRAHEVTPASQPHQAEFNTNETHHQ
jgi:hypothetical protein